MKLYNTLTRKKENFKTIEDDLVKIYVCGVTVYDDVHLGHALSYIYYDFLINYLKHFLDYNVLYVRNITDVGHLVNDADSGEDKIAKRAQERKVHPAELVYNYTRRMWTFFDKLYITRPNIEPFATGHIIEMQDWISKMLENGFAYNVDGNIYYDVSKFKDYYKFSNRNAENLEKNTRFENDPNKKNPQDFALWIKAGPEHIMQWSSPWGKGYPGWHLECSVMSTKYLGDKFDIHGGGVEHVFPHHTNEIAQNYGFYQKKVVNYWVHNAMLNIDGKKMGKSLGNFITIEDYLKENTPQALRLLASLGHYRKPQNYTKQSIEDAEKSVQKLNGFIKKLQNITDNKTDNPIINEILELTIENFRKAMNDDLNTPQAWSSIYALVRETNKQIEKKNISKKQAEEILSFLSRINRVFKVFTFKKEDTCETKKKISVEEINKLIEERNKFRLEKNYEKSDLIRLQLKKSGVVLNDNGNETTWYWE